MAHLNFDTDHLHVPRDQDKSPLDKDNGFYGAESWLSGEIEITANDFESFTKIRIEAEFTSRDKQIGPINPHTHSRVGIWFPIKDLRLKNDLSVRKEFQCVSESNTGSINLVGDSWKFGKKAVVELKCNVPCNSKVSFQICILPCFTNDPSDFMELEFKVFGYKNTTPIGPISSKKLHITRDDTFPIAGDSGDLIDTFIKLGAYYTEGPGNSLHPKQLLTIDALRRVLSPDKQVKICYIGPDTTENICSLLRIIAEDEELKSKINSFDIYSWEEWDEELFNKYGDLERNISANKSVDVNFHKISKSKMITKPVTEEVVTIATYVTPWATKEEESKKMQKSKKKRKKMNNKDIVDNKESYKRLLNLLLHNPNSKLISVDPTDGDSIARSALNSETTNLFDFYIEELQLVQKSFRDLNYDTAVAKVWSSKPSEVRT